MTKTRPFPPQIKYIIGNEGCERFSFYGMRAILVIYMTETLNITDARAKITYHLFMATCYLMPLLGAWISDRVWGRYKTILYLSLFYCLGHAALSAWEDTRGLYIGLGLIALGSGGVKPCVSAFVGDQVDANDEPLIKKVFELFYWIINFGAFFSTLLMPLLRKLYGPSVAFAVPGILMGVATLIFYGGRGHYVCVPPTPAKREGFFAIVFAAIKKSRWHGLLTLSGILAVVFGLLHSMSSLSLWRDAYAVIFERLFLMCLTVSVTAGIITAWRKKPLLDSIHGAFRREAIDAVAATLRVLRLFVAMIVFWALNDQHGSSWVLQAKHLDLHLFGIAIEPDQMPAWNPVFVMVFIPLFSKWLYPTIEKLGIPMPPLRRMFLGLLLTAMAFIVVAMIQLGIDRGHTMSVGFQVIAYVFLMSGEVMTYGTGLEFAYTQAPQEMKSTLMSFWLLTVFFGNLLTALFEKFEHIALAPRFFIYAIMMTLTALWFTWLARRHPTRAHDPMP